MFIKAWRFQFSARIDVFFWRLRCFDASDSQLLTEGREDKKIQQSEDDFNSTPLRREILAETHFHPLQVDFDLSFFEVDQMSYEIPRLIDRSRELIV